MQRFDSPRQPSGVNQVLLALAADKATVGLAWLSLASGELRLAEVAPQQLAGELRREFPDLEVAIGQIGCVLGTHTGPRALALCRYADNLG